MKNLKDIKTILNKNKANLRKNYRVKDIGVFGSYVRGEQKKTSDVDILVEFEETIGLFKFMELEERLKKILKVKKIDLVTKDALKPYIGAEILKEVSYL